MRSKIFLSLVAFIVSIVIADVSLRLWDPLAPRRGKVAVERFSKAKNSRGLRGSKDYPLVHDSYRILALGDSFTYGLKLEESGTWPSLVESALRHENAKVEVLNGGRPGTNTRQQLRLFKKSLAEYNPDLVVVAFLLNDCTKLCSNCGPVSIAKRLEERLNKPKGLAKYSYLFRLYAIRSLERRLTERTVAMYKRPYLNKSEPYQQCIEAFRGFKELSTAKNFKLVVLQYPMLFGLKGDYPFAAEHQQVRTELEKIGIEVADLTPAFEGQNDRELWVHPRDSHPNRFANQIASAEIARKLKPLITKS